MSANDLRAWRAMNAVNREVASVPADARIEYIGLLAASILTAMREISGPEYTNGFLQAAIEEVENINKGEQQA
jgi:hypothetical protein